MKRAPRPRIMTDKQRKFAEAFMATGGNIARSSAEAGCSYRQGQRYANQILNPGHQEQGGSAFNNLHRFTERIQVAAVNRVSFERAQFAERLWKYGEVPEGEQPTTAQVNAQRLLAETMGWIKGDTDKPASDGTQTAKLDSLLPPDLDEVVPPDDPPVAIAEEPDTVN